MKYILSILNPPSPLDPGGVKPSVVAILAGFLLLSFPAFSAIREVDPETKCDQLKKRYGSFWPTDCNCIDWCFTEADGCEEPDLSTDSEKIRNCETQAKDATRLQHGANLHNQQRQVQEERCERLRALQQLRGYGEDRGSEPLPSECRESTHMAIRSAVATEKNPAKKSCEAHQAQHQKWWPQECKGCPANITQDTVDSCNIKASSNKSACQTQCKTYITTTTKGCSESIQETESICKDHICSTFIDHQFADFEQNEFQTSTEFFSFVESKIQDSRDNCFRTVQKNFAETFAGKCQEKITEAQDDKGDGTILLCGEDTSKSSPGCKSWCNEQAKKMVQEKINTEIDVAEAYLNNGTPSKASLSYTALTTADMDGTATGDGDSSTTGADTAPQTSMQQVLDEELQIVDEEGDLTAERQEEGFRWWVLCRKNKNMRCEAKVKVAVREAVETCGELQREAQKCCHQPEQCVGGGLAQTLDGLGKLNVALSQLGSQKRQCEAVQQTFGMYSGMQGAMAVQCKRKASNCTSDCNTQLVEAVKAFESACGVDPRQQKIHDNSLSCTEKFFEEYRPHIVSNQHGHSDYNDVNISKVGEECKRTGMESNRNIQDMSTNLGTALLASVKECEQKAQENGWEWETPEIPGPPNYQPPAPPGPQVPTQPGLPPPVAGGGGGDTTRSPLDEGPSMQKPANPFDVEPDMDEAGPSIDQGGPSGFGGLVGAGSGGGGGGLGGGFGGGGGGGGGDDRGGDGGSAQARKILQGYQGGKFTGYGGSGGVGGGKKGNKGRWGKGKKKKKKRGMASLDLKKLFPKEKRNKKIGQFGSPHDDIFKRVSDRIQYMCKTKKIDCQ